MRLLHGDAGLSRPLPRGTAALGLAHYAGQAVDAGTRGPVLQGLKVPPVSAIDMLHTARQAQRQVSAEALPRIQPASLRRPPDQPIPRAEWPDRLPTSGRTLILGAESGDDVLAFVRLVGAEPNAHAALWLSVVEPEVAAAVYNGLGNGLMVCGT